MNVGWSPETDTIKVSSSAAIVAGAWLALLTIRVVIMGTGIDHRTTIDLWSNPVCVLMGVACGGAFAVLLARNYFSPPPGTPIPERYARLKQNNFLGWCLSGVSVVIGLSAIAAWASASLLGVAAQYLHGPESSFDAEVISENEFYSSRGVCRRELKVQKTDGGRVTICLLTRFRPSLATVPLEPGMPVTVRVINTVLGQVVHSVEPTQ